MINYPPENPKNILHWHPFIWNFKGQWYIQAGSWTDFNAYPLTEKDLINMAFGC